MWEVCGGDEGVREEIIKTQDIYEKGCVDYRNHGPGRVVSGGIFIGKGV